MPRLEIIMHAHLNLNTRAPARLAYLKKYAAGGNWVNPMTWRNVRFATFKNSRDIGQGTNGGTIPIWYVTAADGFFNREKFADEIVSQLPSGWYTDTDQNDTARGIVVSLPHGRFIAGYYRYDNDERVYFPEIYTDGDTAARAADYHAEKFAEVAREDSEKFDAARQLEDEIADKKTELEKLFALRHHPKFGRKNDIEQIPDLIVYIREKCETLQTEYKNYI